MPSLDSLISKQRQWLSEQNTASEQITTLLCPYRINPLGAHVDHQGGSVMAQPIDQYTILSFSPEKLQPDDAVISVQSMQADWPEPFQWRRSEARKSEADAYINDKPVTPRNPADAIAHGLVYVPEDRGKQGAITGLPIVGDISLPSLKETSHKGFVRLAREYALARQYTERLEVRAAALDQPVRELSGGNQQKVVIAKWLATQPTVIILDEPTKGIDIGSKAAVHAFMRELASQGLAVIMVSSEIPEVVGMSDRIIVMREGRQVAEFDRTDATPENLVRAAAGIEDEIVAGLA